MDKLKIVELLFSRHGAQCYGEGVSQLEHALQTALLAQAELAPPELVTAALLHDIGHFLADPQAQAATARMDARHEHAAADWLHGTFPPQVTEPIRLHVDAKRYLCKTDAEYLAGLSEASRQSLAVQGGPFGEADARAFIDHPYAADAVRLRHWDDRAKIPGLPTPGLTDFFSILQAVRTDS